MASAAAPAPGPAPAGRGTAASTCYKCGQSGHWARDCRADPSQRLPYDPNRGAPGQQNQANSTQPADSAQAAQGQQDGQGTAKPKKKAPMRKLTWEQMTSKAGIGFVYATFPAAFRKQFKGRGHETGDLGRLLRMYEGWQRQLFPAAKSFDSFVTDVERFSSQASVKIELRDMRKNVLKLAGVGIDSGDRGTLIGSIARPGGAGKAGRGVDNGADDGGMGLDEDDLLQLQEAPNEEDVVPQEMLDVDGSGASSAQRSALASATAGSGAATGLDEEELAELMGEAGGEPEGGLDEEELAELQDEMFG
mmetsp:Transcript_27729/g.71356  ORF Transcript_27729/g.71356 Transcript_27729/m.71356 type:complete len:306 (-) Transcript_27729:25-942(-)|eukprot:jgi/Tetstr1/445791/TSEL_033437.t1